MKKLTSWSLLLLFFFLVRCSSPLQDPTVKIRLAQDPESLHPLSYGNANSLQILNLVYQSLLTVDLEDHSTQPLLAKDLPEVKITDSLSYFTFKLRPQAQWDNGQPVTAQDVAFSLKLLHAPLLENERWRARYGFIKDILLPEGSPTEFTLVCTGFSPEMQLMAGDFFVLPSHKMDPKSHISHVPYRLVKEKSDSLAETENFRALANHLNQSLFSKEPQGISGSGPYRLVNWENGRHLLLEKKPDWWASRLSPTPEPLVYEPARILYAVIPDNAAAVLALKAQQLDLLDNIPLVSFQEMKHDEEMQEKFNFFSPATFDMVFMGMNGANPLLQDKFTRQALAHLLNIPQIINSLQGGLATPTVGVVHPQEKEFYNQELPPVTYSQSKAEQLLKKAGWQKSPSGWVRNHNGQTQDLTLTLLHRAGNSDFENMALLFQQNARALGIPVEIIGLESSMISERLKNRNYHLYFRTLSGNPFSYNLIPLLHTSSAGMDGANVTNFGNAQTDNLLEQIANEKDNKKKATLLKKLQTAMQEESNLVFLYFMQNNMAISKRIKSPVVSSLRPNYAVSSFEIKD